jgi:arylsulfatase A-like enzyme
MDIAPTILDLLGIDPRALPLFGRSLFAGGPVIAGLQRSAPVGSYASESALVMPDGEKGAVAVPLDDPFSRRPATPEEAARLKAASELMVLSAEYCDALPVRPDFVPDAKMDIPK